MGVEKETHGGLKNLPVLLLLVQRGEGLLRVLRVQGHFHLFGGGLRGRAITSILKTRHSMGIEKEIRDRMDFKKPEKTDLQPSRRPSHRFRFWEGFWPLCSSRWIRSKTSNLILLNLVFGLTCGINLEVPELKGMASPQTRHRTKGGRNLNVRF